MGEWTQAGQALTAGYDLALEEVPGQIQYPENAVVQKDQKEDEEEMAGEVKDLHDIENLFPPGQDDGAWRSRWSEGCPPILLPTPPSSWEVPALIKFSLT